MSSQGSSSVRVYSRAAFVAMAGDPLSQEVSTPSVSFTKSAPEVASHPADEGVTRLACELVSILGHISEEKEDEVAVNCVDLKSAITKEDLVRIAAHYRLEVVIPCELERAYHPLEGCVTLSETYLKFK